MHTTGGTIAGRQWEVRVLLSLNVSMRRPASRMCQHSHVLASFAGLGGELRTPQCCHYSLRGCRRQSEVNFQCIWSLVSVCYMGGLLSVVFSLSIC